MIFKSHLSNHDIAVACRGSTPRASWDGTFESMGLARYSCNLKLTA